ncbi:sugar kinase [Jannaschia sp. LMIT008]|uniref:sugar kinase n=1 Tax=Jannaschia maritima TaxID=3032585 RepID=UPI0028109F2E|nr:sugar kinase [Jannaschia sp. LMIT008]
MTKRLIRRIAAIGEVMIELSTAGGAPSLGVAGDTFNTAVYLARALRGTGVSVDYVTALGTDPYSDRILDAARGHGIGTDAIVRRDGGMPGLYAIDIDAKGERTFSYWRSDSAARTLFADGVGRALDGFDLIHLSGITLAILPPAVRTDLLDALDRLGRGGATISYDSNHRPRLWEDAAAARAANDRAWTVADIALPSLDDEMALHGDPDEATVLARLRGAGVRRGALKRGADGPRDLGGSPYRATGAPVRVVDTTAAGDSFAAGYLAAIVRGEGPDAAMQAGHDLACRVVAAPGAILPDGR